jgi:hypothetical protein
MSTQAAPAAVGTARLRLAVGRESVAVGALFVLGAALLALTWNKWGSLDNDTGYDTLAGLRVAHGDLPYVDFVYYYGPLAPFALGLFSWLGGAGLPSALFFGLLVAFAIVACTYALARAYAGSLGAFLATALVLPVAFSPNQFSYVDPHTHSATLAVLTTLCFLLCLKRLTDSGHLGWAVAAGAALGLVGLTRPEFEIGALLAAAAWLWARKRAGHAIRRDAVAVAVPGLAIPAAVYGAFAAASSVHTLIFENLYPRAFYHAAASTMLHARMPLTARSFAELGGRVLLYAAGVAALVVAARALDRRDWIRRGVLAALGVAAVLALGAAAAKPEALRHGLQFAYGWIPGGAVVLAIVLLRRVRSGDAGARMQLDVAATVALAVVAASTYGGFFIHAPNAQMAVYALPLAAPFLARLHLRHLAVNQAAVAIGAAWLAFLAVAGVGLTLKDARGESAVVRGTGGAIAGRPAEIAVYRQAVNWIETRTTSAQPVLIAPQLTWMYALTERENPLRELSLLPGALAERGAEHAAIAQLARSHAPLVLIDRRSYPGYGHTSFGKSFDRNLAAWISNHYHHAATLGGPSGPQLDVWTRRAS